MKNLKKLIVSFISYLVKLRNTLFNYRVSIGSNFISNWKFKISGSGRVVLKNDINAWAHEEPNRFHTYSPQAKITIGENTKLNGASFQSQKNITIGKNCIIGSAILLDTDIHSTQVDRRTNPTAIVGCKPINIGDNVWIGGRCTILKGVSIGNNSVIGFGSVVTSDIPSNVIAAGNPAKVIRSLV